MESVQTSFPDSFDFTSKLESMFEACRICYSDLRSEMNLIKGKIHITNSEIEACEEIISSYDPNSSNSDDTFDDQSDSTLISGKSSTKNSVKSNKNEGKTNKEGGIWALERFVKVLKPQMTGIESKYNELVKSFKEMDDSYEKVSLIFGENPKKVFPEDLFGIIRIFIVSCQRVVRENKAEKEKLKSAEKARKMMEARIEQRKLLKMKAMEEEKKKVLISVINEDGNPKSRANSEEPNDAEPIRLKTGADRSSTVLGNLISKLKTGELDESAAAMKGNKDRNRRSMFSNKRMSSMIMLSKRNTLRDMEVRSSTLIGTQALKMLKAIKDDSDDESKSEKSKSKSSRNSTLGVLGSHIKRKKREIRNSFFGN
ncbi:hypothetical protein AYI70_g630 [Smittium culicis]|uniref:FH2 domain-containing protein n=1 Tax=Smittium culicis TaxID=133412 RepID=A0A1R1YFZ6_9FUNG|nr:hypothetical protein AYI70_g630 [Smittium culicis]